MAQCEENSFSVSDTKLRERSSRDMNIEHLLEGVTSSLDDLADFNTELLLAIQPCRRNENQEVELHERKKKLAGDEGTGTC